MGMLPKRNLENRYCCIYALILYRCGGEVSLEKDQEIIELPEVLCLHVFDHNMT